MAIDTISGTNFDNLGIYSQLTATKTDDDALASLNKEIKAALPDVKSSDIGQAIDKVRTENPDWTMDKVFDAVVRGLNPDCGTESLNKIRAAWQDFTSCGNLSSDDVSQILRAPVEFAMNNSDVSQATIKNTLALLMLLMVEIAGEESASNLLEGAHKRDEILSLAQEKAKDIRVKAWVNLAVGVISSAVQIGSGVLSLGSLLKGKGGNAKKADPDKVSDIKGNIQDNKTNVPDAKGKEIEKDLQKIKADSDEFVEFDKFDTDSKKNPLSLDSENDFFNHNNKPESESSKIFSNDIVLDPKDAGYDTDPGAKEKLTMIDQSDNKNLAADSDNKAKSENIIAKGIKGIKGAAHLVGGLSEGAGKLGPGLSKTVELAGSSITGHIDANIALTDGKSQVTSIDKDTADKMRQKSGEMVQACLQLLQAMAQADYQTMTAIGRI
ncbi:MAG: hypothetical protein HQK66_10130 [Desulfamplus sp.]|nr:hypothetical protein [Desulfamplus sp.]